MAARSLPVFAAHPGNAALAASIALLASSAPMFGTDAIVLPSAGLVTAKVVGALVHAPLMNAWSRSSAVSVSWGMPLTCCCMMVSSSLSNE
jgi:hypothetical protein